MFLFHNRCPTLVEKVGTYVTNTGLMGYIQQSVYAYTFIVTPAHEYNGGLPPNELETLEKSEIVTSFC